MAAHRVATGLTVEQWDDKFFTEYLTENRFAGEMGTNENNIIQVKENLTKKPGDRINYALVNRLVERGGHRPRHDGGQRGGHGHPLLRAGGRQAAQCGALRGGRRAVLGDLAAQRRQDDAQGLVDEGHRDADHPGAWPPSTASSTPSPPKRRRMLGWLTTPTACCSGRRGRPDRPQRRPGVARHHGGQAHRQSPSASMKYKALVTANPKIRPIRSIEERAALLHPVRRPAPVPRSQGRRPARRSCRPARGLASSWRTTGCSRAATSSGTA